MKKEREKFLMKLNTQKQNEFPFPEQNPSNYSDKIIDETNNLIRTSQSLKSKKNNTKEAKKVKIKNKKANFN